MSDAPTDPQAALATGDYFSSVKQAFSQDLNRDVVRGHFDIGTPPDTHRFYCLVNSKTGKPELDGVAGEIFVRPDGMTGLKNGAVAPLSCLKAEQQGVLVTTGYVLKVAVKSAPRPAAAPVAAPPANASIAPTPTPAPDVGSTGMGPDRVDVAGVRLGMSPDQVRAVLKPRMLSDYFEASESLDSSSSAGGRYVNVIAAWSSTAGEDGESYQVLFTPVPGKERAMAIVHSVGYSASNAPHATSLSNGLVSKYDGYAKADELPPSPTWRVQSDGSTTSGDACSRRSIFGGLGKVGFDIRGVSNPALKTTTEEFRFQIDHCGVAIVTEDDAAANPAAPLKDRLITRFTVTAYSPSIGFQGATAAAQWMQTSGSATAKPAARDSLTPRL